MTNGPFLGPAAAQDNDVLSVDESLRRPAELTVTMPPMDAANGRLLFATKGCVICHEVNGVGGQRGKAPPLDATRMPIEPDPFVFAARMWRGAKQMIALQEEDLGYRIQITPEELADLFAFIHDEGEQKMFALPGRTAQ
jgi:cytochrome c